MARYPIVTRDRSTGEAGALKRCPGEFHLSDFHTIAAVETAGEG